MSKPLKMVVFFHLFLWCLTGVFGVDVSVSVMEGNPVTLNLNAANVKKNEIIEWRFGQSNLIARINTQDSKSTYYGESADGRFKCRLKLDQTGSLTITNTRITDSGVYKMTSSRMDTPHNTFTLNVYTHHIRYFAQCPSSSSLNCSLVCSEMNLSWYKENILSSSVCPSSPHLDKNTYRCELNNLTSQCSDSCSCGAAEAAIRLVHLILVGVALVVLLVYELRSRILQQKIREPTSAANTVSAQPEPQQNEDDN